MRSRSSREAEPLVDLPEAVDVEQHDEESLRAPLGSRAAAQTRQERRAAGEPGHRVIRHFFDAFGARGRARGLRACGLDRLPRRVQRHRHRSGHAGGVAQRLDAHLQRPAPPFELELPGFAAQRAAVGGHRRNLRVGRREETRQSALEARERWRLHSPRHAQVTVRGPREQANALHEQADAGLLGRDRDQDRRGGRVRQVVRTERLRLVRVERLHSAPP
jgi:hypothetical protein